MNDTNPTTLSQTQSPQQVAQPVSPQQPQVSTSVNKEVAPTMTQPLPEQPQQQVETIPSQQPPIEIISTGELSIPKELQAIGIKEGSDAEPQLSSAAKQAGLTVSPQSSYFPALPSADVKIPITYAHAAQVDKVMNRKWHESVKWFAKFAMRQWAKLNPAVYSKQG